MTLYMYTVAHIHNNYMYPLQLLGSKMRSSGDRRDADKHKGRPINYPLTSGEFVNNYFPISGSAVYSGLPHSRSFATFRHEFQLEDACNFIAAGLEVCGKNNIFLNNCIYASLPDCKLMSSLLCRCLHCDSAHMLTCAHPHSHAHTHPLSLSHTCTQTIHVTTYVGSNWGWSY